MTPFLRPEVRSLLIRWAEPAQGAGLALCGLWVATRGGPILLVLGAAVIGLGVGWLVLALRRLRFQGDPASPGLVEIDEGRLRYLHPRMPGEISLNELAELHLLTLRGRQVWRLKDLTGQFLLVPLDAAGAGALFDALSALPGLSSADLVAALGRQGQGGAAKGAEGAALPAKALHETRVWVRAGRGLRAV